MSQVELGGIIKQIGSSIYKLVKGEDVSISDATEIGNLFDEGNDLISNGDFSDSSVWSSTGTVTFLTGSVVFNIVSGAYAKITQNISYNNNKVYKLTIEVLGTENAVIRVRDDANNEGGLNTRSANTLITLTGSTQNIEFLFVANSESNEIAIERHSTGSDYTFAVSNITLKELDESHFDNHVILIGDNAVVTDSSVTKKTKLSNFLVYIQNKLANATTSLSGLMSSNDKGKLDKISGVSHLTSTEIDISEISTNATNISNNASAISTNSTNITNKADSLNPVFRGTIGTDVHTNIDSAITTNQTDIATNATNIATNATNISNKANTSFVNDALDNITLSSPTSSQIPLQATTLSGVAGSIKTININAGNNINFSSLTSGQFTINSTSTATPAGSNGQIQYNNNGSLGATTLTFVPADGSNLASLGFNGTLKVVKVLASADDRPIINTENNETAVLGKVNIDIQERKLSTQEQAAGTASGEIVYFGSVASGETITAGKVYYYAPNGNWTLINANAEGTASGLLAVAIGSTPSTDGMLIKGNIFIDHHAGTGDGQTLYLSTTAGRLTNTKPTGNNKVRIVGTLLKHYTNRCEVFFNPANFDGQATNPASSSFADIYSISFEGTPDYAAADLPDDWGKNEGTLSVWVNLNITDNVSKYLLAFTTGDGSFNDFVLLQYYKVTSGKFAIICRQKRTISGTSTEHVTVAQQSSDYWGRPFQRNSTSFNSIQQNYESIRTSDTWTHIAVTWDADATYTGYNNVNYNGNQTIYVNGAKVGEGTGTMPGHNGIGTNNEMDYDRDNDLSKVYLGTLSPSHGTTHMLMDDLAIWNTALDGDNIEAIYNSGTPTNLLNNSGDYDESNNLAGYWKFENNVNDSKGTRDITKYGDSEFVSGLGKTPST